MRRWILITLLVLLPTQFSWAAVATYCGHETGRAARHFGHHEHATHGHGHDEAGLQQHVQPESAAALDQSGADAVIKDTATQSANTGQSPNSMDLDCSSHCHGKCSGLLGGLDLPAAKARPARPATEADGPAPAHTATRPERPQWRPLA